MPDWTKSMEQTFEYYIVDPGTWRDKERIKTVTSCSIDRDWQAETLGSATLEVTEAFSECYIRIYLIVVQNGLTEKLPLATVLVQTPSSSFDGKISSIKLDAYTPLLELKENPPPIGYSLLKGENIMENAYEIVRDNVRAPVVKAVSSENLYNNFVANTDDTWLSFCSDLMANAKFLLDLDELGRVLFAPQQEIASLQPVWTYNDDNSSILYPSISFDYDLYGIPNAVEVVYSDGDSHLYAKIVNDDPNSPISTVNRGREILHRITDPDLGGTSTKDQIEEYAEQTLEELSSLAYTVTYTHGYCPARIGDCVRLNYKRAWIENTKARVISQSIKCEPGCPVTEKAVFTVKLWRR